VLSDAAVIVCALLSLVGVVEPPVGLDELRSVAVVVSVVSLLLRSAVAPAAAAAAGGDEVVAVATVIDDVGDALVEASEGAGVSATDVGVVVVAPTTALMYDTGNNPHCT
jgi:hypothetical protein